MTTGRPDDNETIQYYLVEGSWGSSTWQVKRRYSDFYPVDAALREEAALALEDQRLSLPDLPPKRFFSKSDDPAVVRERFSRLNTWLQVVSHLDHPLAHAFIGVLPVVLLAKYMSLPFVKRSTPQAKVSATRPSKDYLFGESPAGSEGQDSSSVPKGNSVEDRGPRMSDCFM